MNCTARDLVETGTLSPRALEACIECSRKRRNILITGTAGAGKTVLIKALAGLLPADEPLILFDDCVELQADGPYQKRVPLHRGDTSKPPSAVIARALHSNPTRLVIGNVCPPEAGEVLRALGSGRHDGSFLAMSAESTEMALRQLATWSMVDGFSWETACAEIANAIHLVVLISHLANRSRHVEEVAYVETADNGWTLRPI